MITASELAGFVAAHAIWCVSEADGLIPMLAFTTDTGERQLERLAFEDTGAAVHGRTRLEKGPTNPVDGVLAYDGRVNSDSGKLDAIILELRSYAFPWAKATIAVPYTPQSSGRFAVHKPKLIEWEGCEDFNLDAAFEAFFAGVDSHEQGSAVWSESLDESI